MTAGFPLAPRGRDHRLDIFRGLALMTIFINHVPGNAFEKFTSRNFGFSDAAEAFVLMSGIAVGLAYSRGFKAGGYGQALLRVWKRAGTIYVAHIVTSVLAIAILGAGILFLDAYPIVSRVNFTAFLSEPLAAMVGLPILSHQIGYFNILPLYFVLLAISPLYILVGLRSRLALVMLAMMVWIVAGAFRLNFPNFPNPGGWFFNPMSWQLIYAIGIAAGLSAREGNKFVPYRHWLFGLSAFFLAFSIVWMKLRMGAFPTGGHLPFFIAGFDKTFLSAPRLLHALALAYVLTNLSAISRFLKAPAFRPIELMGQYGLSVFATGSVVAITLQVLRVRFETNLLQESVLLLLGILIQYGVARFLSETSSKRGGKPGSQPAAAVQPVVAGPPHDAAKRILEHAKTG